VDDPLNAALVVGLERDDVSATTQGHEVILEILRDLRRGDHLVQTVQQPVVRDAHLPPNACQGWAGGVQHLALLANTAIDLGDDVCLLRQTCGGICHERKALFQAQQRSSQSSRTDERIPNAQQVEGVEACSQAGIVHKGAHITHAAQGGVRANVEQIFGLGGLSLALLHFIEM